MRSRCLHYSTTPTGGPVSAWNCNRGGLHGLKCERAQIWSAAVHFVGYCNRTPAHLLRRPMSKYQTPTKNDHPPLFLFRAACRLYIYIYQRVTRNSLHDSCKALHGRAKNRARNLPQTIERQSVTRCTLHGGGKRGAVFDCIEAVQTRARGPNCTKTVQVSTPKNKDAGPQGTGAQALRCSFLCRLRRGPNVKPVQYVKGVVLARVLCAQDARRHIIRGLNRWPHCFVNG